MSCGAYCIVPQLANSNVSGNLAIRDLNNWVIKELLLADLRKTQYTSNDEGPNSRINLDQTFQPFQTFSSLNYALLLA